EQARPPPAHRSDPCSCRRLSPIRDTPDECQALEFDLMADAAGHKVLFVPLADSIPSEAQSHSPRRMPDSWGMVAIQESANAEGRQRERWRSPERALECPRRPARR